MADCLEIMKEKYTNNIRAYLDHDGLLKLESSMLPETFMAQLRLDPDDECVDRLSGSLHTLMNMNSYKDREGQDIVWVTGDEWVETLCWYVLKRPRSFSKTWAFWISACFDAMDQDTDGYINEDEFNIFYKSTNRRDDKAFAKRAFSAFDTKKTGGKLSRQQFVTTFVRYFTDPDTAYNDLPLY